MDWPALIVGLTRKYGWAPGDVLEMTLADWALWSGVPVVQMAAGE